MSQYPNGKMNAEDMGAMPMSVGVESGRVVMRFPESCDWIGLDPDGAVDLAQLLIRHACKCGSKKPIVLTIGK